MNLRSIPAFFGSTTARLAVSYLMIIMIMSLAFSFVLYETSAHELDRQLPPASFYNRGIIQDKPDYHHFFEHRIDEGRGELLARLILLNVLVLMLGSILSYYLARRTLQPIESAMEGQNRFVTDASHELRTPLTAMLASNEVALRKSSFTLKQAKDVIKSNTEELAKLIGLSDGLLSLARQDNQATNFRSINLQDVVSEAMNRVVKSAQAKKISIEDKVPALKVTGDVDSLVQALVILLDNAIKYSPEKSQIHLDAISKDKHAYLSVRDQGSGISPVDLPHIFDRFYRADLSRNKLNSDGYGIGLSIAKKILEQHGGHISVSSAPGQGSTFTLELPLAADA